MTGMTPERLDPIRQRLDETGYAEWKHAARELLAEVDRLRAIESGIEALTRTGYDHTPDCVKEQESARAAGETFWHPDCGRCWEDSLHNLLNPTEGETDGR